MYIFDAVGRISVVGDNDYVVDLIKNENTVRGFSLSSQLQFAVGGRTLSTALDISAAFL